jgi:hypothetical protein
MSMNTSKYNEYITSPIHKRQLFIQYYYKYTPDAPCFPTVPCYELVPNVLNPEHPIKYWMGFPQEPTQHCLLDDWQTANIHNCQKQTDGLDNLNFLITITIILNCLYMVIIVISSTCNIQMFGYIVASINLNNIFSIVFNIAILNHEPYKPLHIIIIFIHSIASWVIGLPIIICIEQTHTYRRLCGPQNQPLQEGTEPIGIELEPIVENYINNVLYNNGIMMINNQPATNLHHHHHSLTYQTNNDTIVAHHQENDYYDE